MTTKFASLIALPLLSGWLLLGPEEHAAWWDADDDGALAWEDCDNTDPNVKGPDTMRLFADGDLDDWGGEAVTLSAEDACPDLSEGSGLTAQPGDCDDDDDGTNPEAEERCDAVDNDCDGESDEDGACNAAGSRVIDSGAALARGSAEGERLGWALVGGQDFDGDGSVDVAITSLGLTATDAGRTDQGRVTVLFGPLEDRLEEGVETLTSDQAQGGSASDSPDARALAPLPIDGGALLVVGAPLEEPAAGDGAGEAWLLTPSQAPGEASLLALSAELEPSADLRQLGWAVSASAAIAEQPGFVALGAPESSPIDASGLAASNAGAVALLRVDGDGQPDGAALLSGEEVGGWLGHALASGDLNGDGCADLLVSARESKLGGWEDPLGAVALVEGACALSAGEVPIGDVATAWFLGEEGDETGLGAAIVSGVDVTDDGYDDALVSAPERSEGNWSATGAVWLLRGAHETLAGSFTTPSLTILGDQDNLSLGAALSLPGDINADGVQDVAIGAPGDGDLAPSAGSVWIAAGPLEMSGGTWTRPGTGETGDPIFRVQGTDNLSAFGASLAPGGLSADQKGDTLLIGAPAFDGDELLIGQVYLFVP